MELVNKAFTINEYTKYKNYTRLIDQYLKDEVWYAVWDMNGTNVLFKLHNEVWVRV